MKVLYGIQSTGNGHISRSIKIISRLKKLGWDIDILVSGRNSQIKLPFEPKWDLMGFTFKYKSSGEVDYKLTWENINIIQFIKDLRVNVNEYDLIISDFEPITAWASKIKGKKSIGISNQMSFLSKNLPRPEKIDVLSELVIKNFAPVKNPIGLSFDRYDDFIFTPIINDNILKIKPKDEGYYLVYLPNMNLKDINESIRGLESKFRVFHGVDYVQHSSKVVINPLDKFNFQWSMSNCQGVITAAGFQTTSESLFLGKKLMVIPIKGQYEQECNSCSLSKLGVRVGELSDIGDFIKDDNPIKLEWIDSTDQIIEKIIKISKNN